MTEGYEPRTANLDDEGASKPVLRDAPEDDVLMAMEFGMAYQNGKRRSRAADELGRKTVARMIYQHLMLSGYVILQKPPRPPHTTHGFGKHLTE
jgi:hypothetical protein